MNVKGSVKDRLKTWFFILQKRKKKIVLEKNKREKKTVQIVYTFPTIEDSKEQKNTKKIFSSNVVLTPIVGKKKGKENLTIKNDKTIKNLAEKKILKENTKETLSFTERKIVKKKKIVKAPFLNAFEKTERKFVLPEEKKILMYVKSYVKKTNKEIHKMQKTVEDLEEKKDISTKEQIKIRQKKLNEIYERICFLKKQFAMLQNNYELKGYETIGDDLLYQYIDNFKFKSSMDQIDCLTEQCKAELLLLEKLSTLEIQVKNATKDVFQKQEQLENFTSFSKRNKQDLEQEKQKFLLIEKFIQKENAYLDGLEKENKDWTVYYRVHRKRVFRQDLLQNLASLYTGIYVFPTSFFGAFIGAYLVHNSLTPLLKQTFVKEEFKKYYYKEMEYGLKIQENQELVQDTLYLLSTSLDNIKYMRKDFINRFQAQLGSSSYQNYLNIFNQMIQKIEEQQKKTEQQKEILLKQEEKQKQKILNLEKMNRN